MIYLYGLIQPIRGRNRVKRSGGPAIAAAALRRKSNKLLLFFADSLTNSLSSVLIHSVISACPSAALVSLPSLPGKCCEIQVKDFVGQIMK